jgi:hypothetical protein
MNFTISNPGVLPVDFIIRKSGASLDIKPTLYDSNCYFTGNVTGITSGYVSLDKNTCDSESGANILKNNILNNINCDSCNYDITMSLPCPNNSVTILDPDALSYVDRAQISDFNIREDINNFIVGLKEHSLWNKFKNIWILKSGYNFTGNNFYDLKNANFSGTFVGTVNRSESGYKVLNSDNTHFEAFDNSYNTYTHL